MSFNIRKLAASQHLTSTRQFNRECTVCHNYPHDSKGGTPVCHRHKNGKECYAFEKLGLKVANKEGGSCDTFMSRDAH